MNPDEVRSALAHVSAVDRDVWWRMCAAVKSELGEPGYDIWDEWSQVAGGTYKPKDCRAVWRSTKAGGAVTIATLVNEARRNGWQGEMPAFTGQQNTEQRHYIEQEDRRKRAAKAARTAKTMIASAEYQRHAYLDRKGFPEEQGLVARVKVDDEGMPHWQGTRDEPVLLVAMRQKDLVGLQMITTAGRKKFLPGSILKGSSHVLGSRPTWFCEGYATALSVRLALRLIYCNDGVAVCFSAGNIPAVASRGFVIADHDENGTGQKCAEKTGLQWWMPPEPGDANDYHQKHGLPALAEQLRLLRRRR